MKTEKYECECPECGDEMEQVGMYDYACRLCYEELNLHFDAHVLVTAQPTEAAWLQGA